MSSSQRRDVEKERYWEKVVGEAARSGLSIRARKKGPTDFRKSFDSNW